MKHNSLVFSGTGMIVFMLALLITATNAFAV